MSLVFREARKFLGNNLFSQVKEVALPLGLSVRKGLFTIFYFAHMTGVIVYLTYFILQVQRKQLVVCHGLNYHQSYLNFLVDLVIN
jgi:hypothetical protein